MPITPLPTPPSRADDPAGFSSKADAFVSAMPVFTTQANQLLTDTETAKLASESARDTALSYRDQTNTLGSAAVSASQAAQAASESASTQAGAYKDQAGTSRAEAQAAAAAAAAGAGLPSLVGNAGKSLVVSAAETGVNWASGLADGYIELTSSQTWAIPPEATWLWIEVVAAGGGGKSGTDSSLRSGGSGGQCVRTLLRAQDMPTSVSVVVGAGGAGTSGAVTANDGGDSSFGAITALGGRGGIAGCTLPKTFSTTYSASTANPILSFYDAGGSVYITSQIKTVYGGGGGGSESSAVGVSQFHGNGGFGSTLDADGHAGNGVFPGGGGGGRAYSTSALRMSGAGANGTCKIWWW